MAKSIRIPLLLLALAGFLTVIFVHPLPAGAQGSGEQLFMPVVQRHDAPPPAPGYIANPGFENGYYGWVFSGGVQIKTNPRHSGTWAANLGGPGPRTASIEQRINVPSAGSPRLEWWQFTQSEEFTSDDGKCEMFRDSAVVKINNTVVAEFPLCETTATNMWGLQSESLSAYRGQIITLHLEFNSSDIDLTSNFYVDDFAVK